MRSPLPFPFNSSTLFICEFFCCKISEGRNSNHSPTPNAEMGVVMNRGIWRHIEETAGDLHIVLRKKNAIRHTERLPPSVDSSRPSQREVRICCRRPLITTHYLESHMMPKYQRAPPVPRQMQLNERCLHRALSLSAPFSTAQPSNVTPRHLALHTLSLAHLGREPGLDGRYRPSRPTRVARHEVKPILTLAELGVGRTTSLARHIFH